MTAIFICVEGNKSFSALNTTFYTRAKSLSNQKFDKNVSLNDLENRSETSTVWVSNPFALPLSEAEPEGGPDGGPEAESEIPSDEPGSEPEASAEDWPEPGPFWPKAYEEWGMAWEMHVYVFAVIFLGFAVCSSYFIGHGLYAGLDQKYLGFSLNIVMLILGATRAFVLFTDPYLQGTMINNVHVMRVIWSLASPCLTSADCLVILSLVETAKISLGPQRMQKFSIIIKIILLHFALVLITDFVVSAFVEAKAMLVFCQVFFILWGTVLGIAYFILAHKLDKKLFANKEVKSKKEKSYIYLIYASGVNNFVLCIMFIYSSAGVFGVYSDVQFVGAWPWWAMQTCFRVSEVSSAILVFTVSAKRKRLKKSQGDKYKDALGGDSSQDRSQQQGASTTGKEKDRRLSLFSQLHSAKVHEKPGKNANIVRKKLETQTDMLTDLHEAKIEAYYASEDV